VAKGIMKINTTFSHNIWFRWACKSRDEEKKFLPVQTNTKHSPSFLSQLEILLQLAAVQFVALLLKENVDSFLLPWNSFLTQDALWVMKQVAYSNPTYMD
jgi:hypothetical protein